MTDYLSLARTLAPQQDTTPTDDNPYMAIARDEQAMAANRLQTVVETALRDAPDIAAERLRLSKQSGVPLRVVERNLDELRIKERARTMDLARMASESPVLARQMVDPTFTTPAIDDIPTLQKIEQSIGKGVAYVMGATPEGGLPSDAVDFTKDIALGATVGVGKTMFNLAATVNDLIGWQSGAAGMRGYAKRAQESMDFFGSQGQSSTAQAIRSGAQSAGQNLAMLPIGLERGLFQTAEAAASAVAAAMATGVGAEAFSQAREKGKSNTQALAFAIPQTAFEYVFEQIPASKLFKDIALNEGLLKTIGKQFVHENWTEQLTTLAQDFNEWMNLNPDKTMGQFIQERPEAIYQTFVATLVGVGVQTSALHGINKIVEKASNEQLVFQQDLLDAQMKLAAQSMLRQRSPEQFRAHVQNVIDENSNAKKEVYVDGEVLNQLAPELLNQLPQEVRDQIESAVASNSTVAIPMADVLTIAPGTELENILNEHARMTPDSASKAEAKLVNEMLRQDAERVLAEAQDQAAWQQSADNVKANLLGQLNTAGRFTPEVNEAYSAMARDFYATMAGRLGITPEEMYQRYPLRIAAQGVGGQQLDQGTVSEWNDRETAPVGSWVKADFAVGGVHPVYQVREMALDNLYLPELDEKGNLQPEKRKYLAGYTERAKAGEVPPSITVIEMENGKLRVVDGHRRAMAARAAGKTSIRALVSPLVDTPEGKQEATTENIGQLNQSPTATPYTADTITVDGKERPVLNSNGQRIAETEQGLTNFWRWFGDSRVVDAEGKPLVVYHGTADDIDAFKVGPARKAGHGKQMPGVYFSPLAATAGGYARSAANAKDARTDIDGANIVPTYVSIQNPAEFTDTDDFAKANKAKLEAAGHYGAFRRNVHGDVVEIVAFNPTQVKSAIGNDGTFDPQNANILRQNARGTYSPDQLLITLNANADLSTFLHESGHFFLEVMADLASQPNAPADIQDDMGKLLKWFGIKGDERVGGPDAGGELAQGGLPTSAELVSTLKKHAFTKLKIKPKRVLVAGSFATGKQRPDSDIDVVIEVPEGADAEALQREYRRRASDFFMKNNLRGVHDEAHPQWNGRRIDVYFVRNAEGEAGGRPLVDLSTLAQDGNLPTDTTQPAGRTPLEVWNAMTLDQKRQYHERFAESFEQYLLEGKAPSQELQPLFRKFRSWLVNVYKSLTHFMRGRDLKLSDEVRQVFDRMLAAEDAIKQQEEASGLLPDFDATNEAIEKLQARSLRDLKWTVNARNRALKALQKEAAYLRKAVEDEVRAEVEARPEVKAKRALDELRKSTPEYKAALAEWNTQRQGVVDAAAEEIKTSLLATEGAGLKGIQKGQFLAKNKRRIANEAEARALEWERSHKKPERTVVGGELEIAAVADATGFESTEAMLKAIDDFGDIKAAVEGMTDQRMLENFGELATPEAIEEAANDAVHNEARAKSLATELKAQADMLNTREQTGTASNGRAVTVNALTRAAKEFGANLAARRKISDLKRAAQQHRAAEAKAGRAWQEATAKGQTQEAVAAKRDQVLNNAAVKALVEAQAEAKKIVEFFRKVTKDNNEKLVDKGRDPDVVNAMRAILAAYDVAPRLEKSATEYLELVARNDPAMYGALKPAVDAALASAKPLDMLTMEELRGLNDELRSMWHLAKRSRQMEIDGNLLDRQAVEAELQARMQEIGVPDKMPGDTSGMTKTEKRQRALLHYLATGTRVESWADKMGPQFTRYVWNPVKDAITRYRKDKAEKIKALRALLEPIAQTLKREAIDAPELGYTFGKDEGTDGVGMNELLHAILHTGNDSNKRKLLLGRGWATENPDGTLSTGPLPDGRSGWDAFISRMHSEGKLTKMHWDFAQGVWDLLESTKALAQKTHRDVFGRYFDEVTANPVETPFGTYRGGYVPATADSRTVADAATKRLAEDESAAMQFAFPSTSKGFTKSRVEYNVKLRLDLRTLSQHLDKVLLFSHLESPVRDVRRILTAKPVAYSLNRIDPQAFDDVLTPWLNRASKQLVDNPDNTWQGWQMWKTLRNRAGMAAMFGNIANAVQQFAGVSMAAVKVKPTSLLQASAQYVASPRETAQAVAEKSEYMNQRLKGELEQINAAVQDILLNPSVYESGKNWINRHAYFAQTAIDNVVGPIVWTGAYNDAIARGESEMDAVRSADAAVRMTQGATAPEDISSFESGSPFSRLFTQFAGYFNMQANLLGAEFAKVARDMGLRKGAGRALYVLTFGYLVNAWVAEAIMQVFKGGPDDDDKDGEYLDDWLAQVFGWSLVRNATAVVPVFGQATNSAINVWNAKPYDDRLASSPVIGMLESAVNAPKSVYKAMVEDGKPSKALRDVGSAVALFMGVPLNPMMKSLGYVADVADNRVNPTSPVDAVRGTITGTASGESKR